MAATIVFAEEKLASTQLGSGQSATVMFTPLEGPIEVTAFPRPPVVGKPSKPSKPKPGTGTPGKVDPDPEGGEDGPGVPPPDLGQAKVRVELFPPGAQTPETTKTFSLEELEDDKPFTPLKLGVRPNEAGKAWRAVFRNTGGTAARVTGTVKFVKERIEEEPPPPVVSVDSHAELPSSRLRPGDGVDLPFKPTAGTVEILVAGAEVNLKPAPGKEDPNPERGGDGVGVTLKQNVRIDVSLLAPGVGTVATGDFRSTDLFSEEAQEPVVRHTVMGELADKTWICRFTNRGKTDVFCAASVRFLRPTLRTDIPVTVLNHGLRQLIEAIALEVRIDGKRAVIGVSEELQEFVSGALGGDLSVDLDLPVEFSDVNLYATGIQAQVVNGRPRITGHAMFEARGEEVEGFLPVDIPLGLTLPLGIELPGASVGVEIPAGTVDASRLAITIEIELRTVEINGRRVLQPITAVDVDVSAFAEVLHFIGVDLSDIARSAIADGVREMVASPQFTSAVSRYLTEGLMLIVQRGHEFQELRGAPGRFVVLHTNPDPGAPPLPAQPPEVDFPRPPSVEPRQVDEASGAALAKIDHLVVLMQENRSFDQVLGYLSHPDHGLPAVQATPGRDVPDGLKGGESNPRIPGKPVVIRPYGDAAEEIAEHRFIHATAVPFSPHHEHEHVVKQINGGAMDGFVNDFVSRFPNADAQFAMRFYTGEHLPVFDALAADYAICDRWFSSHPGPTQPNRFCTLSGHTPVPENFELGSDIYAYLRMPTIFDVLTDAGVDWRYYEGDIGFLRMYDRYRFEGEHLRPMAQFFEDAQLGQLPPVSFVDPNFADVPPAATANDDHPPADLRFGQALVARIYDALRRSPRWITQDESAGAMFIVTYDEHGGFFDHVAPPGTERSEAPDPVPLVHPGGKSFYGPRVPTFAISPFVRPGRVDHTVYDHTSVMATILDRFVGDTPAELGPRVAVAHHLAGLLELDEPRRPEPLPEMPAPTIGRRFRALSTDTNDFHAAMRSLARPRRK